MSRRIVLLVYRFAAGVKGRSPCYHHFMLGPVAHLEWLHACRRGRHHFFRGLYVIALFAEFLAFLLLAIVRSFTSASATVGVRLETLGALQLGFLLFLLAQHFLLLALATPTLAAGAIADEKTRGSLALLLTTDLTTPEIVVGKWLGQVLQVLLLMAPIVPLLALLAFLCGFGWSQLLAWMAASIVLVMTLAAASLLASVWARRTSTAVMAVYIGLAAACAGTFLVSGGSGGAALSHWEELLLFTNAPPITLSLVALATCVVCLTVACWRLRPAFARQASGETRSKKWVRWLERPAIGANPLRWKECHAGDLGLLSFVQRWPRSLRLGGVALASFGGWSLLIYQGQQLSLTGLMQIQVILCGVLVMIGVGYVGGVRASAAISAERERQTWDNLLATPLTTRQLVRGKVWGVIDGARPYLIAYIIPSLAAATFGGIWTAVAVLTLWVLTWGLLYYHVANGVYWSSCSSGSWQSLLKSAAASVRDMVIRGFFISLPAAFFLLMVFGVGLRMLLGWYFPEDAFAFLVAICFLAPMVVALFGHAEELLQMAEKHIAKEERVNQ